MLSGQKRLRPRPPRGRGLIRKDPMTGEVLVGEVISRNKVEIEVNNILTTLGVVSGTTITDREGVDSTVVAGPIPSLSGGIFTGGTLVNSGECPFEFVQKT